MVILKKYAYTTLITCGLLLASADSNFESLVSQGCVCGSGFLMVAFGFWKLNEIELKENEIQKEEID